MHSNIDYSYLILKNADKVHEFIEKHGFFVTNAELFWNIHIDNFSKLSKEKQKDLKVALKEVEKDCLKIIKN